MSGCGRHDMMVAVPHFFQKPVNKMGQGLCINNVSHKSLLCNSQPDGRIGRFEFRDICVRRTPTLPTATGFNIPFLSYHPSLPQARKGDVRTAYVVGHLSSGI